MPFVWTSLKAYCDTYTAAYLIESVSILDCKIGLMSFLAIFHDCLSRSPKNHITVSSYVLYKHTIYFYDCGGSMLFRQVSCNIKEFLK